MEKTLMRPKTLQGETYKGESPFGNMYLTINSSDGKPYEVFIRIGKMGSDVAAVAEGYGRLMSLHLKTGGELERIADQLTGIGGTTRVRNRNHDILCSLPDAIAKMIKTYLTDTSTM